MKTGRGKVNVLHIVNTISGKADGVFRHIFLLCRDLDRIKFRVFLAYQGGEAVIEAKLKQLENVECIRLPKLRNEYSIRPIFQLVSLLRKEDIHIVHAHFIKPLIFARLAARMVGTPVVIFKAHGLFYDTRGASILKRMAYVYGNRIAERIRPTDCIIAPSRDTLEYILGRFPRLSSDQGQVIYDGADLSTFEDVHTDTDPFGKGSGECLVGVVARLTYEKSVDRFIRCIPYVLEKSRMVRFVVVGDGPLELDLKRLARDLGVYDRVWFTGYRDDVQNIMNGLDVVVIPSQRESGPLVLWEAMALGKPVIAAPVGAIPEVIRNRNIGILLDAVEEKGIADAIVYMVQNESVRLDMGECGRQMTMRRYNSRQMVSGTEKLYARLLWKKQASRRSLFQNL